MSREQANQHGDSSGSLISGDMLIRMFQDSLAGIARASHDSSHGYGAMKNKDYDFAAHPIFPLRMQEASSFA